jgi:3-hydroxyisobutyrate dehydrogenase-like beta-hydroxyacid dehydrogenase
VTTVGIVSPGAMGSAVGAALVRGGARVVVTLAGRSERTARLAREARLEILPDLRAVVRESDVVLSIAPPEAAEAIADDVCRAATAGDVPPLFADLNAVAPTTVRRIEDAAAAAGVHVVDGSISGPPPRQPGTRVYLSGEHAEAVAQLPFDGVTCIVVGPAVGSASAVKMSTASVYKGTTALVTHALLAAHANGVLGHVLDDLHQGAPELVRNVARRLALAASKSGRYVGEMHEIAATQSAAGFDAALFEAIAGIYGELSESALAAVAPEDVGRMELEEVLDGLHPPEERSAHVGRR